MHSNVIDCLRERGFVDALTHEELREKCESPLKVYIGFDPTANSLHLGSLMGIIILGWFQRYGHTPYVILGGATGRIGDPSGKSVERPLLDAYTIMENIKGIRKHFEQILDFFHPTARPRLLNNDEWFSKYQLVDFLRDIGKHFRVGQMLGKESVRARLESDEGISFTEFSYQLLQAYDFYHLFIDQGLILQVGGSDQWGNITAGVELIRKLTGKTAYGLTTPLLTRSDGKKFGKSEEGAIWLSKDKLSPYHFYQYLVRVPDADVIKLMRLITYMEMEEIREIEQQMSAKDYLPNSAQKRLAAEVTRIVHGEEGLQEALRATEAAAPGGKAELNVERMKEMAASMPHIDLKEQEVLGARFVEIALRAGLVSSKGEGVRLIQNAGAYLNEERVSDPLYQLERKDLVEGKYMLLGSGKKKKILILIV